MKFPEGNPKYSIGDRLAYLDNGQHFRITEIVAIAFNDSDSWLYAISNGWLKHENELVPLSLDQGNLVDKGRPEFLSLPELYDSGLPAEMMNTALTNK